MSNERVIKKYANRRLYDSTGSRHVTLEELRKLSVSGEKVTVIADQSDQGLPRAVYLMVISEHDQFVNPVLRMELVYPVPRYYCPQVPVMMTQYDYTPDGTM